MREEAKRKVLVRDFIFGGSCVPTSLPFKDSPITRLLQVALEKERKIRVNKNCKNWVNSAKLEHFG